MSRVREFVALRWIDAAIVTGITVFVGILSGAQRWSGWSPPDSSFYLTLGLFGDQVTDRAIDDSYFWTRLGSIAPVRVLTEVFGVWPGLYLFRLALVGLLVVGSYAALRRFTGRAAASYLTIAWALSTVVISFLGNPYLTGAVLAATTAVIACAVYSSVRSAVFCGLLLGWLTMLNPTGFLLALTLWFVISVQRGFRWKRAVVTVAVLAATGLAFILIGRILFPGLNWLATVKSTATDVNYSDFADSTPLWLGDISLLVPVLATLCCLAVWWRNRADAAAQVGVAMSVASVNFMLVFSPILGGFVLEAPLYQAMLWPPTLLGLSLALTAVLPREAWSVVASVVAGLTVVAILIAGRIAPGMTFATAVVLSAVLLCLLAGVVRWRRDSTIAVLLVIGAVLAFAQLAQNSREQRGFFYHLTPYVWAFQSNVLSDRAHAAVNTQEWLLANTASTDRVSTWVQGDWFAGDRELYEVAAMQLWGPNRVAMAGLLYPEDLAKLEIDKPTVIAMYAWSMDAVIEFWSSIPAANSPTAPECYDFQWASYPDSGYPAGVAHACLTRLHW